MTSLRCRGRGPALARLADVSYSASTSTGSGELFAAIGDLELCYETFGEPSDPALVLIMGLAMQMIGWREDFCERLASRGFFVVRFDNRDVGRSTRLDDLPVPTFWQLAQRDERAASYTLEDMATDVVGLLDHLQIGRAWVAPAPARPVSRSGRRRRS